MQEFETILLEKTNNIATITFNRPNAANGINPTLAREFAEAALICDKDKEVRCVILTANGKLFCAGGDLKTVGGEPEKAAAIIKGMADDLHRATSTLARMEKPFIRQIYDGIHRSRIKSRWKFYLLPTSTNWHA